MKYMKKQFLYVFILMSGGILNAQDSFTRHSIQEYFRNIVQKSDSSYLINPDTLNDGTFKMYQRWKYFWSTRVDTGIEGFKGYIQNVLNYNRNCVPGQGQWNLLGPGGSFDIHPAQELGIITAIAVDPTDQSVAYIGTNASGLWKTNNGLYSGTTWINITDNLNLPGLGIQDIVIDPMNTNIIYIATGINTFGRNYGIGVYKSIDGGVTWQSTGLNFSVTQMKTVRRLLINPLNPNTLYAAVDDEIYKTTNGGYTWTIVFSLPNNQGLNPFDCCGKNRYIRDIEMLPNDTSTIYFSTDFAEGGSYGISTGQYINCNSTGCNYSGIVEGGPLLFKTTDGFSTTPILLNNNLISALMNSFPNNFGTNSDFNRVTRMAISLTNNCIYVLFSVASFYGFAINYIDAYLCKSCDGGNTWNIQYIINQNAFGIFGGANIWNMEIAVNQINPNIIYGAGTQVGKTSNGGINWNQITDYTPCNTCKGHADIRVLKILQHTAAGSDVLIIGNDGGVSVSYDGGNTWINVTQNLPITQFYDIGVNQNTPIKIIGGTQDNGSFEYKSQTNSWVRFDGGDGGSSIIDYSNDNISYHFRNGAIFRNYGGYWYDANKWWLGMKAKLDPLNPNILYFGGTNLIKINVLNTPSGPIPIYFGPSSATTVNPKVGAFDIFEKDNNILYLAFMGPTWNSNNTSNSLFKTLNATTLNPMWIDITNNVISSLGNNVFSYLPVTDLVISPKDSQKIWLCFGGITPNYRIIRSIDGGTTWSDYSNNLPPFPINAIIYEKGSDDGLYVGTDVGVFYTNNKIYPTQGWICFSNQLPVCIVTDLEINYAQNKIYAATFGRGIWVSDLYCPSDYDLNITSSNYTLYNNQFNEAEHDIILSSNGSSYTLNNFIARAGNEIVISPTGNDEIVISGTGHGAHLFIHPCNHPGNSFRQTTMNAYSPSSKSVDANSYSSSVLANEKNPSTKAEIQVYPNPVEDHLHVDILNNIEYKDLELLIKSIEGRILLKKSIINRNTIIDTYTLLPGMYIISIYQSKKMIHHTKLIKI